MLAPLIERLKQGYRTLNYPQQTPTLPERYRGLPSINASQCPSACSVCADVCPTGALTTGERSAASIDLGKCLFCGYCADACPQKAITFTTEHRLACRSREELVVVPGAIHEPCRPLDEPIRSILGRSLRLRQVSAGGCNACEADTNVLGTLAYDLGRFGIQFVASPRHADGILVTGPVSKNMQLALKKTYEAVPAPKIVVAVGACAISGGIFADHAETLKGAASVVPVDLFVPGCPPHPLTILNGLLSILGRIPR